MKLQLILVQDPALLSRVVQSLRPVRRADDLVGSPPRRYPREDLADAYDRRVGAVAPDGFVVHPAYIRRPAIVVRVRQAARVVFKVHTS